MPPKYGTVEPLHTGNGVSQTIETTLGDFTRRTVRFDARSGPPRRDYDVTSPENDETSSLQFFVLENRPVLSTVPQADQRRNYLHRVLAQQRNEPRRQFPFDALGVRVDCTVDATGSHERSLAVQSKSRGLCERVSGTSE
ncbi:uncharacterized protein LOC143146410 [Ptiloglossa arizonensis]|uniref:uncharacterized protein LOC143146410 n=1 Tax=Ptiloglossa arizonensis TaxID=3350558 RepID=UPI003F9FFFAD